MGVVIVHPRDGIYLGNAMGLGFWSLMDCVGQDQACVFTDENEAKQHIASWDNYNDVKSYRYVLVMADDYADITILKSSGLETLLGDMVKNTLINSHHLGTA